MPQNTESLSQELVLAFDDLTSSITKLDRVHVNDVKLYYAASLIDAGIADSFRQASLSDGFWKKCFDDNYESADDIFYLVKLGLPDNEAVNEIVERCILDSQDRHGYIMNWHTKALRVLVNYPPHSEHTDSALNYFLDFISDLESASDYDWNEIPSGMLALMELDFDGYKPVIDNLAKFLLSKQSEDGGFNLGHDFWTVKYTCECVTALSRFLGPNDQSVVSAVEFLKKSRPQDGWNNIDVADVCIALTEAGQGSKIAKAVSDWNTELLRQRHVRNLPAFVHTSPIFGGKLHVKQIHDKIMKMFREAKTEVLIASLFTDMMYEDIINIANRGLSVRIVMRPGKDAKGLRERINKNVVELLKMATKGNVRTNEICHTRMIIVDSREVLVSTADLTRDQLYDEFNAGIWTQHAETVCNAVDFFENLWSESEEA